MGGSSKSSEKSSSWSGPWSGQEGYLRNLYSRAEGLYQDAPLGMYPDQMYSEQDPMTGEARAAAGAYGMRLGQGGSDAMNQAAGQISRTAAGDYMKPSPYLDETYQRATQSVGRKYADIVGGGITSRFGSGGRSGSPSEMRALRGAGTDLGRELGGMATDIYGGAYDRERGRQFQAAGMLPSVAQAQMSEKMGGFAAAEQAGLSREQRDQQELNELIERFNFAQEEPYARLTRQAAFIGAPITESTSYGSGSSRSGSGLGGFFMGY